MTQLVENFTHAIMSPSSEPRWECPGFASLVGKTVEVEGTKFTVSFEIQTNGEWHYEFEERPGELFKASRCLALRPLQ
jgi:hypothetical protein